MAKGYRKTTQITKKSLILCLGADPLDCPDENFAPLNL